MKRVQVLGSLTLVAVLAGCTTIDRMRATQLEGGEVQQLVAGRTLQSEDPASEQVTFARYGTAVVERGGGTAEMGLWRVVDDALCVEWHSPESQPEACFTVHRVGSDRYQLRAPDGSVDRVLVDSATV